MPGRRMSVRDGDWLPSDHLRVIGPLSGVTAPVVRETLIALHRQAPTDPSVCTVDRRDRRWVAVSAAEFAWQMGRDVAEFGTAAGRLASDGRYPAAATPDADGAEAIRSALMAQPLRDRPLRVLVGGGFAGIRMSHAVGDGRVFNALVPRIFGGGDGEPPQPLPRPVRLPLARAALRFFGADPRRVAALLRVARPVLPEPPPGAPSRPWHPDAHSCYARSGEDLLGRVREWRDRYLPGVSTAAVLFAATRVAFERCGLSPEHPGLMIPVDARRFLPATSSVGGNFTAAQYIEPASPRDPRAIQEALQAAMAAGRPLSTLVLRDLYSLRARGNPAVTPDRVRTSPAPQLTLTHVGRLSGYAGLPWACPPSGRCVRSAPTPNGAEGVTVSFAELAGAVHLNLTYHRSTFDADAIRRVAELICADPAGLLAGAGAAALSPSSGDR